MQIYIFSRYYGTLLYFLRAFGYKTNGISTKMKKIISEKIIKGTISGQHMSIKFLTKLDLADMKK
jgi:hypothetical protein